MHSGIVIFLLIFAGLILTPFIIYHFFIYPALITWINSFYPMTPDVKAAMYWVIIFFVWLLLAILGIVLKRKDR